MAIKTFIKAPDANLKYGFDWTKWLGDDIVLNAVWNVPAPLVLGAVNRDNQKATAFLGGGEVNKTYLVSCHMTTVAGEEDTRSLYLKIQPT